MRSRVESNHDRSDSSIELVGSDQRCLPESMLFTLNGQICSEHKYEYKYKMYAIVRHSQKIAPLAQDMPKIVAPSPLNGGLTAAW